MTTPVVMPNPLPEHPTVAIIVPSTPAHIMFAGKYRYAVAQLESIGCAVVEGALIRNGESQGYRTASGRERAREFMECIEDPDIDMVMTVIGGMNSSSLLPFLDYEAIRASRKIITGYSDITSLHLGILAKASLATVYGPTLVPVFGEWPHPNEFAVRSLFSLVRREHRVLSPPDFWSCTSPDWRSEEWKTIPREYVPNERWTPLRYGKAEGELIVANLNTLVPLLGSEYCPDFTGRILLIEEMDAPFSREERSFQALALHGIFSQIQGLILSKPEIQTSEGAPFTYEELLLEIVGDLPIPIIGKFDCGHTSPMISFFQTMKISLVVSEDGVRIEELNQ